MRYLIGIIFFMLPAINSAAQKPVYGNTVFTIQHETLQPWLKMDRYEISVDLGEGVWIWFNIPLNGRRFPDGAQVKFHAGRLFGTAVPDGVIKIRVRAVSRYTEAVDNVEVMKYQTGEWYEPFECIWSNFDGPFETEAKAFVR